MNLQKMKSIVYPELQRCDILNKYGEKAEKVLTSLDPESREAVQSISQDLFFKCVRPREKEIEQLRKSLVAAGKDESMEITRRLAKAKELSPMEVLSTAREKVIRKLGEIYAMQESIFNNGQEPAPSKRLGKLLDIFGGFTQKDPKEIRIPVSYLNFLNLFNNPNTKEGRIFHDAYGLKKFELMCGRKPFVINI